MDAINDIDAVDPGLRSAFEAAGSKAALSRKLSITRQAISSWKRVPAERVLQVERATGITRNQLRPDLYPEQG